MLSHHAPPKRLLHNFTLGGEGNLPKLWVYSRGRKARPVWKVTAESAENGYFKNDPNGRAESEIDAELNERYEAPFNRILPALTAGIAHTMDRSLIEVCADYVAGLFLRSKPRRKASKKHTQDFNTELMRRLEDPLTLRRYAAKVSLATRSSVPLAAVVGASRSFLTEEDVEEKSFFLSATTPWSHLPTFLRRSHWSICSSPHLELIQSDVAVALLNISSEGSITYGTGVTREGSQWFLPISSGVALRASAEHIRNTVLSFRESNALNEFMVRAAHSAVYSAKYSAAIETFTNEHIGSIKFFRDMIVSDVASEVDSMISGLLSEEERSRFIKL